MAAKKSAISIRALSKKYGKLCAVDKISLEIPEGEVFALLGPNGAGKTTTLSMLCGLLEPSAGSASVAGFDVEKQALAVRQSIGVVFQQPSVDDLLSGKENLEMHALLYGVPADGRKERIEYMLKLVGLSERQNSNVKEYSGGMRRRLEIARGLMHHPKVLFLDEPTVGLDPQTRSHIWKYIHEMPKREGTTIVFTTHYLEEAEQFADRVAIIDHGKVLAVGKPSDLVAQLGGDTVVLGTADQKTLMKMMKRMKFAKNVRLENGKVCASISDLHQNLPKLLRTAKSVNSIEIRPATLNEVFIKYTGANIREDSAEGGFWERMMSRNK